MTKSVRWYLQMGIAIVILGVMAHFLRMHGEAMVRSASLLASWNLATAFCLCLIHRVVNAAGWGLILGSLGQPVQIAPAARVWLASEACRWIPGSVWAFGSRAALASARGVPMGIASLSVVYELMATVLGWALVGGLVVSSPEVLRALVPVEWLRSGNIVIYTVTLFGIVILGVMAAGRVNRVLASRLASEGHEGRCTIPDGYRFAEGVLFYAAMAAFNGVILLVILRSLEAGRVIPVGAVLAINAIAWLTGFFAIFAPGGLVVREACVVGLLSTWVPTEQALAVALAWRLLQVVAEIATFGVVVATGLPVGGLRRLTTPADRLCTVESDPSIAEPALPCRTEAMCLGVA